MQRFLQLVDYYDQTEAEEGRQVRRRPPRRGAPVHGDQLHRREVGLGGEGPGDLRQDGRPALRGRDLPAHGRRLLRPDPPPRRHRRLPAGAAAGPARRRRAEDPAEDRPGLRARPEAERGLRRVRAAGQRLRAGHALVREAQERPRGAGRHAGDGGEEPLRQRGLPPPAGPGAEAAGQARGGEDMFESAAKGYEGYLERFPRSKSAYEMQFYAAECQYNSLQFAKAAQELRGHPRQRLGRPVPGGRRLRRGARLEQAHRAAVKSRRSSPGTRCSAARTGPRARSRRASRWRPRRSR